MKEGIIPMNKQTAWIKPRHKVVYALLRPLIGAYTTWKYGIKVEKFREENGRQYLVVLNHQTGFDQFFPAMAMRQPLYFIASEDIFSIGWVSKVLTWLVAPIPIRKQTTDIQAVKNCIKVAKEGGSICLAPEGNRTFHGRNVYMNPSIGSLARKLALPIAVFRIEGGYGIQPRWSDVVRRGKMRAYVSEVIEPEEFKDMTAQELFQRIEKALYVDEGREAGPYVHKKAAEYLERAMYVCPFCGLSEFESHDDLITCKKCGRQIRYTPTTALEGVGFEFPYKFVADWYDYQCDFVNGLDVLQYRDTPIYEDTARLSEVIVYKHKKLLKEQVQVRLYGDRLVLDGTEYPFSEVSAVVVLGKNKVNIYHDKQIYQLKGSKRFNALKYVNLYHRYKNIVSEKENGKFLGL